MQAQRVYNKFRWLISMGADKQCFDAFYIAQTHIIAQCQQYFATFENHKKKRGKLQCFFLGSFVHWNDSVFLVFGCASAVIKYFARNNLIRLQLIWPNLKIRIHCFRNADPLAHSLALPSSRSLFLPLARSLARARCRSRNRKKTVHIVHTKFLTL